MGGMTRRMPKNKGPARGPNFGCAEGGAARSSHACGDPQSFWKQVELSLGLGAVPPPRFMSRIWNSTRGTVGQAFHLTPSKALAARWLSSTLNRPVVVPEVELGKVRFRCFSPQC